MNTSFFKENKWAIWLILICLVALGVIGYFVFRGAKTSPAPKVTLSIDAPPQVPSGKEIVYKVQYNNDDSSAINNVSLNLIYPSGFSFENSTPTPATLDGTQFNLPDLNPGQNGVIMIKGILVGNAGETKTISGILHYKFQNLNSDFTAQAQIQSNINNSDVTLQFSGLTSIPNSQTTTYTITYTNTTDQSLNGLIIKAVLPQSFQIASTTPQQDNQGNWDIAQLGPNQSGTIQITGQFSGAQTGVAQTLSAEIDGPADATANTGSVNLNNLITYSNTSYQVNISTVPLEADLTVQPQGNTPSTSSDIVQPGDQLTYTLNYKNNDTVAHSGVIIQVTLSGVGYDLSSIQAQNASVANNVITWNASQVAALNALQPNQSGTLSFVVNVNNPATGTSARNLTLNAVSSIQSSEFQQPFQGAPVALKIQTTPSINASVAYGSGANPPLVNHTTGYVVTLVLNNTTNDLGNAVLTMNLPNAVGFDVGSANSAERANLKFDPNTKKLTWNVGTLAANAGRFTAARKLQFTINITPNITQLNSQVVLANNISLTGTDQFTNSAVTVTNASLSTQDDPSGNGTVGQ